MLTFSKMHGETRPYTTIEANISNLHAFLSVNYVKCTFANMCSKRSLGIKMAKTHVCNIITTCACSFFSFLVSFLGFKVVNRNIEALCKVQFSTVTQSCLTFCNPMHCSTPGLPVHYQLPEFTQTLVQQVGDAIQPSHPLSSSPSPPASNPSQHQSLFQ